jgi:ATP-dependent Clp protease ATP-binding subunit ClpC
VERSFTPRLMSIQAVAEREADLRGRRASVVAEDLLFSVLWEGESLPAGVLGDLGVAEELLARLDTFGEDARPGRSVTRWEVLGAAVAVADEFGHDYLGVEHVFLGMIADEEGTVARLLDEVDVLDKSREGVLERMRKAPGRSKLPEGEGGGG